MILRFGLRNITSLFFSILITLLLYFFFEDHFGSLNTEIRSEPKESIIEDSYSYFEDINYDGFSEEIVLKTERNKTFYALKVLNHNGVIDQWNFKGRWLNYSLLVDDYDNDKIKEIFIFTVKGDSLYLSCIDINYKPKFEIQERFIISRKKSDKPWDVSVNQYELVDIDQDGYKELYFLVFSGFDHSPRKVLRYDMNNNSLVQSDNFPAALTRLIKMETDNNEVRFLVSSTAYANYLNTVKYSDSYAWLFLFDKNLNLINEPKKISEFKLSAIIFTYSWMKKNEVLLLKSYNSSYNEEPSLKLLDDNLNVKKDYQLPDKNEWSILPYDHFIDRKILLTNNTGQIFVLDSQLNLISQIQGPFQINKSFVFDVNQDYINEMVLIGYDGIFCINSDLEIINKINFTKRLPIINTANQYKFPSCETGIAVDTDKEVLFINFRNNPYSFLIYFLLITSAISFFFLIRITQNKLIDNRLRKIGIQLLLEKEKSIDLIISVKGIIKFASRNVASILEIDPYETLDKPVSQVLKEEKNLLDYIYSAIMQNKKEYGKKSISLNGNVDAEIELQPVEVKGIVLGFVVKITKTGDKQISENQKKWLETIQQIAHNIKTPISSIQLNLETIKYKLKDGLSNFDTTSNEFELIFEELNRIKRMSKDFIRATNVREKEVHPINLEQMIKRIVNSFSYKDKIKITMDIDPESSNILSNPQQLELLLTVIIENSYDAIEEIGRINISTSLAHNLGNKEDKFLAIEIADTGRGVPAEITDKIFEPFFTTKPDGTGLGLSIARQIVRELGGEIQFYSKKGFSTTLRVMLPIGNKDAEYEQNISRG